MAETFVLTGTVTDSRTVALDEAVPLTSRKVRVVVEPLEGAPLLSYPEAMAAIRARQDERSHRPRAGEEVDAALQEERASWDR